MPFREWNFAFRESASQFRELLREYPGTLRELREWPFHSESGFLAIGVVPRLLKGAVVIFAIFVKTLVLGQAPCAKPSPTPVCVMPQKGSLGKGVFSKLSMFDDRQIAHLICARLKYDLYDFFRGYFWAFYTRKRKEAGPTHPLKKSYRSYLQRAQIR